MKSPREPDDEAARLDAVRSYDILGATRDEAFDALVRVAASVCDAPVAIVSLIDAQRQWFLAAVGMEGVTEMPRESSLCGHAILGRDIMVVENASEDPRFTDNPLVVGPPGVRFYAGCPLVDRQGFALGALCVVDRTPRTLAPYQQKVLRELSRAIVRLLEARRVDTLLFAAEQAAKSARADLEIVLDAVAGLVGYWDTNAINRFANQAYSEWFGQRGPTIVGKHIREVIGEQLYALNLPYIEGALSGERQRFEREIVDASGKLRYSAAEYTPDIRDGKVHGFIATVTDVTELKEALLTSQRRTALLQLAEEQAEMGHWRIEVGKEPIYWSPEVYRIHGVDPATFVPTIARASALQHPDDRERVRDVFVRAIEHAAPFEFEHRIIRPDGATRLVHAKARSEVDPATGRARAVFGIFHDITDREALRERIVRQERLVTTGTLAAGVGHEINNPLTYVGTNIELAIDELRALGDQLPASKATALLDVLGEAREGTEQIGKIVRGLRAFARENAPLIPTDVHAAIDISVNMAVHALRGRATVTRELGNVPLVLGDESRLSQIFVNLLVNAAHAFRTDDLDGNRIIVRTKRLEGERVAIEVEDNGPGIAADVLPRIFDPFFTTKAVGQGTGLGLSISHSLATSLGGDLTCVTRVGEGTTFRVVIRAAGEPCDAKASPISGAPPGAGAKVLVVDDQEALLRSIVRLLQPENRVTAFSDPRDALRTIESGADFDVVFCDLMMPHLTGMLLYRLVQARRPSLAERFVFITGGTILEEVRSFLASVPNECLEKPFGIDQLRNTARRFAGRAAATP